MVASANEGVRMSHDTILGSWWSRRLPPGRAVTVLVLEVIAIGLSVWAALSGAYDHTTGTVIAWVVAGLLTVDVIRLIAGLAAGRRGPG
jgi:hypothetical protein